MRYLPLTHEDRMHMMREIGISSVDELYVEVPKKAFIKGLASMPLHKGEMEVETILSGYANENHSAADGPFFLGAGCYYHHIPSSVDYIIQRSEFMTAYTPYQPEIAQGTLQVIFEYQTMIANLCAQDIANASLYDGATAMTEGALMAMRLTRRNGIVLKGAHHPHYKEVLESYMKNNPEAALQGEVSDDTACMIVQYPDFRGEVHDLAALREECDTVGAKLIVVVNEIVALGLLPAPEAADIVCGEAQSVGLPMSYGGPHLGFLACHKDYVRQMPGRLCGETVDEDGRRSFVLTLSTREQHIRREKATSNICTNQGLCALAFTVHMALLGEDGLKHLARLNHERACDLADALEKIDGVTLQNTSFFNEFVVELDIEGLTAATLSSKLLKDNKVVAGYPVSDTELLLCATEMTTEDDIKKLASALKEALAEAEGNDNE